MSRWMGWCALATGVVGILFVGRLRVDLLPTLDIPSPTARLDSSAERPDDGTVSVSSLSGEVAATGRLATVYIFMATRCPISNGYIPELNRLAATFSELGVQFIGVVPGANSSDRDVARHQHEFEVGFQVLRDRRNVICEKLKATHTPQVVVVTQDDHVVYSGRIDDRWVEPGRPKPAVTRTDLLNALTQLSLGENVTVAHTKPVGCLIEGAPRPAPVHAPQERVATFARDVAPIVFEHCSRCHRPNEAAPFSLLTYIDTAAHARQIQLAVQRQWMPPWKPVSGFGRFKNEHRLTQDEIGTFRRWVAAGLPEGDRNQLPDPPRFTPGWQLGTPDLELVMPEAFDVPADGPDIYRHFVIPTGLTQNRLVSAFEFRPGAPEVVHHAFVYFDTTGQGRRLDAEAPGPGYSRLGSPGFAVSGSLGGWGPGGLPRRLPPGTGRPLMKDSDLVVQIHYHPSGKPARDRSRIGLFFAPQWADRMVTEIMVADVDLEIPAGAARYHHRAEYTLPVETIVLDATPHMHNLGREIKAVAHLPNGRREPLIWIKDWDFYWQDNYVYGPPIRLAVGTRIELDCWFDNSAGNPLNPNSPPKTVRWGDYATDEMGICYFQVTTDTWDESVALHRHVTEYFARLWNRYQARRQAHEDGRTSIR